MENLERLIQKIQDLIRVNERIEWLIASRLGTKRELEAQQQTQDTQTETITPSLPGRVSITNVPLPISVESVKSQLPVVTGTITVAAGNTADIAPPTDRQWIITGIYHTQPIEIYRVHESIVFGPFLTNNSPGAVLSWEFPITQTSFLRVKNIGSSSATIIYEGREIRL